MGLFTKLLGNRKEKDQLNKLVAIAENDNLLDSTDLQILKEDMSYLSTDHPERLIHVDKYRKSLPADSREKFHLVFFLVQSMMINGGLSDKKEMLIGKLLQVMDVSKDKARELTSFLRLNILNGLSVDDSFQRLGYLLDRPKYS